MLSNNYQSKHKVLITLEVSWDRTVINKQTLFPIWGDKEERKAKKGAPLEGQEYTLRATKGVNMHPYPIIKLIKEDGTKYSTEEEIKLSVVSATDRLQPPIGSCSCCGGNPILAESKQYQLIKRKGETFCKIRGGILELTKLQIGCCTGSRGHGQPFCIKAEFVTEGSPLKGRVVYSLPIEVGAKGPFAKIFCHPNPTVVESTQEDIEMKPAKQIASSQPYEGANEMINLLRKLNLEKYIDLFVEQEVDIQAFLQLTDEDLTKIGITKVGPKVKILKEIARLKDNGMKIPCSPPSMVASDTPPSSSSALQSMPSKETFQVSTPIQEESNVIPIAANPLEFNNSLSSPMLASLFQDEGISLSDPPSKRRKLLESYASNGNLTELEDKVSSIYIYLSNIMASNNILKKTLFMVKSESNKWETEQIVQQIQQQVVTDLIQKGKYVFHEGKAQLMLTLQPDKNGDWVAKSVHSDQVWNFKKGDYIKIDNHHNVDISINVHYYYIPDRKTGSIEKSFVEDFRSPKKYPTLFPGGSLEIGVDEHRDGRLALAAELDFEPSETFAVTKNGKLIAPLSLDTTLETCNFSFKRRKDNMKKAESFDDFQKEIFLSKCLDPTAF